MKHLPRRACFALLAALICFLLVPLRALANEPTIGLGNGTYLIEVTLEGGTGRASVASPTTMTVKDGEATATIEWSSPFYDYMVVNGTTYLPTNEAGNSTFAIPVPVLDKPFSVVADTTAMSTPHEIEYKLTFKAGTAQKQSRLARSLGVVLPILVLIIIITTIFHVRNHP